MYAPVTENKPATGPVTTPLLVTPSPQLMVAVKSESGAAGLASVKVATVPLKVDTPATICPS